MRVALVGPIDLGGGATETQIQANLDRFDKAELVLAGRGHTVYNPARRGRVHRYEWSRADFMRASVKDILQVEGIALLPGWGASPGATVELSLARQLDLIVIHIQEEEL